MIEKSNLNCLIDNLNKEQRLLLTYFIEKSFPNVICPAVQVNLPKKTEVLDKKPLKTPIKILEVLALNPNITIPELAQKIDRSKSATKRAVRNLRKSGHLKRVGSKKGGHWEVVKKDNTKE